MIKETKNQYTTALPAPDNNIFCFKAPLQYATKQRIAIIEPANAQLLIRLINVLTVRAESIVAPQAFRQAQGERKLKLRQAESIVL